MATQFTKKFVQTRFENWAADMGFSTECWRTVNGKLTVNVGAVYLDCYQGYQICRMVNEGGGIEVITGSWSRHTGKELDAWMQGSTWAVKYN